jgi:hypothetical protein
MGKKQMICKKIVLLLFACFTISLNMSGESITTGPLTWRFMDGTLTISGKGAMPDYDYPSTPWYNYHAYIENVIITEGVTSIGNNAYCDCGYLTSITISNSVTSIGNNAFRGCNSLTSITIPDSVTSIGEYAFLSCNSLNSIVVEKNNPVYSTNDGVLFDKEQTLLVSFPAGKSGEYVVDNSVTSIGEYAFYGCSDLSSITIPNSVTNIGSAAFSGCSGLSSISISNSITSIESAVFSGCSSLTSITIPNSVISIGNHAFENCIGLSSITIPNSVSTSIGYAAFYGCSNLNAITIINVTMIENMAFGDCTALTSITIPNSVTNIGEYAFWNCSNLTSISVGGKNPVYSAYNGVLFNKNQTKLVHFPAGKSGKYLVPNSVTSIGIAAFNGCNGLTSITIPNSVKSIGDYAFKGCAGLKSITIPNSISHISDYAFMDCINLTSITIPHSITSIGECAFMHCSSLSSITIPYSVTSIGFAAFYGYGDLSNIEVQWSDPLLVSDGVFEDFNLEQATLIVPPGTKSLYEAANIWKDFGTIVEKQQEIFVKEVEPAGANGYGKLDLYLNIPADVLFVGSFNVKLPVGFQLDMEKTIFSEILSNKMRLNITQNEDGSLLLTFKENIPLQSGTEMAYSKIAEIVYTIDESVSDGLYEINVRNLDFTFDDDIRIVKEHIPVKVMVDHTYTGNQTLKPDAQIRIVGDILYLNSLVSERINIYSVTGVLLYSKMKSPGGINIPLPMERNSILILKGSSGWVKKIY